MKHCIVALCLASPVQAETPITIERFEAIVTGQSYTWARPSRLPFGVETYGSERRVLWTVFGQDCKEGIYFEGPDNQVCFDYPDHGVQQCWRFFERNGTLHALSLSQTPVNLRRSDIEAGCIEEFLGT